MPLIFSADFGLGLLRRLLLECGTEADRKEKETGVMKRLLEHGIENDPKDFIGRTSLEYAVASGREGVHETSNEDGKMILCLADGGDEENAEFLFK